MDRLRNADETSCAYFAVGRGGKAGIMATLRPDKASTDPADSTGSAGSAGEYGDRVVAVEPGGVEPVPTRDRHGSAHAACSGLGCRPTWSSPRSSSVCSRSSVFGLSFWQAVLAILIGNALGSVTHGVLSARGPRYGVPQMVLSRLGFGYWGNVLPAGLMSVTAGIGWFAVNSVSGAFALNTLTGLPLPALPGHRRGRPDRHRLLRAQPGAGVREVRLRRCSAVIFAVAPWSPCPGASERARPSAGSAAS